MPVCNHVTVVPHGGLCNRLRVVLSAYHAAEKFSQSIRVEWGRDSECWAFFEDLFEPIAAENFALGHRSFWNNYISRKNLRLPGLLRLFLYGRQQSLYDPRQHGDLMSFIDGYRKVYLSTGYVLMDYPGALSAILHPVPALQTKINDIKKNFSSYMVGVHIRRTDHVVSMSKSTVSAFYKAINREIAEHPEVMFYLATDDSQLKKQMQLDYPHRFLVQDVCCNRNTLEGIEGAVVDLWLLASTSKILGSYYSSYSDMAAEIGGISLEVVQKDS